KRATHMVAGLPEGFFDAFAVLYRDFAEIIAARRRGGVADPLTRLAPTADPGVRGCALARPAPASRHAAARCGGTRARGRGPPRGYRQGGNGHEAHLPRRALSRDQHLRGRDHQPRAIFSVAWRRASRLRRRRLADRRLPGGGERGGMAGRAVDLVRRDAFG